MTLVLSAWFLIKWDVVKLLQNKSSLVEITVGSSIIVADYVENAVLRSRVGIIDLLVIFVGLTIVFYGIKSFRYFWVPATYGLVLLLGYQIENAVPNYVALQDWLASVMSQSLSAMGIASSVSGHLVVLNSNSGSPLTLDVASDCTGLQGVLAFGMLSTMTLLDMKPKMSRLVPLFTIGFAGAFLINIVRLLVVFLSFEFLGVDAGITMHFYFGYIVFIVWVLAFWLLAFRFLTPVSIHPTISPTPSKIV